MKRLGTFVFALLVVLISVPSQAVTLSNRFGSHAIIFTEFPYDLKNALCAYVAESKSKYIRMDFTWTQLEPMQGTYQWNLSDDSVRAAKGHGLELLALVTELPDWASSCQGTPDSRLCPPQDQYYSNWYNFIANMVKRYGSRGTKQIKYWEIWNEPNTTTFWKGTTTQYAKLYSLAYDAVKANDPNAVVLLGGNDEENNPQWIYSVLADSAYPALNKIDILNAHIRGTASFAYQLAVAWKQVYANAGITGKPLWVTEFGYTSDPYFQWDQNFTGWNQATGEQKQAAYYNYIIPYLLTSGGVDKLFLTLHDDFFGDPHTEWYCLEGLIDVTGRRKPSFNTIKTLGGRYR